MAAATSFAKAGTNTAANKLGSLLGAFGRLNRIFDAARADKVNAILADERKERQALWESRKTAGHDDASKQAFRDKMIALRDSNKTKLTAVLTADELQKLRDATAGHRMHRGHGPQSQGGEHKHG